MGTRIVVVGVDGPARTAALAINIAATEATHRRATLRLIAACDPDQVEPAGRFTATLATCVRGVHPEIAIQAAVRPGNAAHALVAASSGAELVVVAGDAHMHYDRIPGGRVAAYVAAHASAPVLVVPAPGGERPRAGRVVVGVDGGPTNATTIGFAFDEAAARGATLHAVTVWDRPARHGVRPFGPLADPVPLYTAAEQVQTDALAAWLEKYPEVPVRRDVVRASSPVQALCHAAADAELLVVGSRGRGGYVSLRLGTIASGLVHYSPTPLVVVRP